MININGISSGGMKINGVMREFEVKGQSIAKGDFVKLVSDNTLKTTSLGTGYNNVRNLTVCRLDENRVLACFNFASMGTHLVVIKFTGGAITVGTRVYAPWSDCCALEMLDNNRAIVIMSKTREVNDGTYGLYSAIATVNDMEITLSRQDQLIVSTVDIATSTVENVRCEKIDDNVIAVTFAHYKYSKKVMAIQLNGDGTYGVGTMLAIPFSRDNYNYPTPIQMVAKRKFIYAVSDESTQCPKVDLCTVSAQLEITIVKTAAMSNERGDRIHWIEVIDDGFVLQCGAQAIGFYVSGGTYIYKLFEYTLSESPKEGKCAIVQYDKDRLLLAYPQSLGSEFIFERCAISGGQVSMIEKFASKLSSTTYNLNSETILVDFAGHVLGVYAERMESGYAKVFALNMVQKAMKVDLAAFRADGLAIKKGIAGEMIKVISPY